MFSRNEKPRQVGKMCEIILSPFSGNSVTRKLRADLSDIHHCQGFNLAINSDIKSTCAGQAKVHQTMLS